MSSGNTSFLKDNQKYNDDKKVEKINRWDSTKKNDFIQNIDDSKLLSLENKLRLADHNINKQGMNELVFEIVNFLSTQHNKPWVQVKSNEINRHTVHISRTNHGFMMNVNFSEKNT